MIASDPALVAKPKFSALKSAAHNFCHSFLSGINDVSGVLICHEIQWLMRKNSVENVENDSLAKRVRPAEISSKKNVDLSGGFFKARDKETGDFLSPHIIAEYATAAGLLVGAHGLYHGTFWGREAALVSLGALAYTSMSNLSWALSKKERFPYVIAMSASLIGACLSLAVLF